MPRPKIFISYSHKDKVWLERLVEHLGVSADALDLWDDRRIAIGDDWLAKIERAIDDAHAAVLLISPPFLTSKFIREVEVPRLLERRSKDGLRVFPILIRGCAWETVDWLKRIQMRPEGKPLDLFTKPRRDSFLAAIAQEIQGILSEPSFPTPPTLTSAPPDKPALAALHQLPSPPADFTGREEELAELRQAIGNGVSLIGLAGMGGLGKTTLALKLAEELKPSFPDAQIYLDLKGVDPTPLAVAEAMAHVVRTFHPEVKIPTGDAELQALYRSVLEGKRALLLMDNAANREQVEPLIPPRGCSLLVTSRFHFHVPGLVLKDLAELPEEEARDLLLRIAPRIGHHAVEIARLCGRLPIALRLAGGALAERRDLFPSEYARRLMDTQRRLKLVDAHLSLSYDLLSEELRKHWRELAVFPGTFDAAGAAAVWEMESDSADEMLGVLVKSSLVDGDDGRYRLHDLARVFAESRLGEAERTEARRRHAAHYRGVLATVEALYLHGGESVLDGVRLYDLEWGNIQAGFVWTADQAEVDEVAARLCSKYMSSGLYCLQLRQPKRERIQWLEHALAAARRLGDSSAEGWHLGNMGIAYAEIGDMHRAIEYFEQGLQIAREIGDRHSEGNALTNLGITYMTLRNEHRAIEHFEQGLQIALEIGDRRGEGAALGNLGNAYRTQGHAHLAIEHYEQWLQIAREIGDRYCEGTALGGLGTAYAVLGDAHRAIEHHEQWLQIAREIGDRGGEAKANWHLGLQYEAKGNLGRAVELMQREVEYGREIGHQYAETLAARVEAIRARIQEEQSHPKKVQRKRRGTSNQRRR